MRKLFFLTFFFFLRTKHNPERRFRIYNLLVRNFITPNIGCKIKNNINYKNHPFFFNFPLSTFNF